MTDFEQYDEAQAEDLVYRKRMAVALLNDAINHIYNIEGDRWQMAYDVLEGVMGNLNIEVDR
ncbi:MAG: hypothetical protein ACR2IJ_00600 [Fluviibacter sp.]